MGGFSKLFIYRPVLALVISIVIVAADTRGHPAAYPATPPGNTRPRSEGMVVVARFHGVATHRPA